MTTIGMNPGLPNDCVDAALLRALQMNAVDLLVTEDHGIHAAARRIQLGDRVYYVAQCASMLSQLFEPPHLPPTVLDKPLYAIDNSATFFDSLRSDYHGFDKWFSDKSREGRRGWAIYQNDSLAAVCIYKEEAHVLQPRGTECPGLKLCTFKVGERHVGNHFGEVLLKAAFSYCVTKDLTFCYCTVRQGKPELEAFLLRFGFRPSHVPGTSGDETAWIKYIGSLPPDCRSEDSPLDFHVLASPAFDGGPNIRKFAIPVQPPFHQLLFPDCPFAAASLLPPEPVGNAIRKAYLCHSPTTLLRAGDLLLFYRSRDWHAFTTLGIVEDAARFDDAALLASVVGKRTVYRYSEIERMVFRRQVLAVQFRQIKHLRRRVLLASLKNRRLIRSNIESIHQLGEQAYNAIALEGG